MNLARFRAIHLFPESLCRWKLWGDFLTAFAHPFSIDRPWSDLHFASSEHSIYPLWLAASIRIHSASTNFIARCFSRYRSFFVVTLGIVFRWRRWEEVGWHLKKGALSCGSLHKKISSDFSLRSSPTYQRRTSLKMTTLRLVIIRDVFRHETFNIPFHSIPFQIFPRENGWNIPSLEVHITCYRNIPSYIPSSFLVLWVCTSVPLRTPHPSLHTKRFFQWWWCNASIEIKNGIDHVNFFMPYLHRW